MRQPSKTDPNAPSILTATLAPWGESIAVAPKTFSSGSIGYYFSGKVTNPESGERYQVSIQAVLVGSKPA